MQIHWDYSHERRSCIILNRKLKYVYLSKFLTGKLVAVLASQIKIIRNLWRTDYGSHWVKQTLYRVFVRLFTSISKTAKHQETLARPHTKISVKQNPKIRIPPTSA